MRHGIPRNDECTKIPARFEHQRLSRAQVGAAKVEREPEVLGPGGAGKSTVAEWMMANGLTVLGDDVCVVRFDEDGRPMAYPGIPRLRMWEDALDHRGISSKGLRPSYPSDPDYRKLDLPVASGAMEAEGRPFAAIFCLKEGDAFSVEPLSGSAAIEALFAHTYRGQFVIDAGDPKAHWQACLALAQAIPVLSVCRSMDKGKMDKENAALLAVAKSVISQRPAYRYPP